MTNLFQRVKVMCAMMLASTMPVYAEFKDAVEMTGGEFVCSGDTDWLKCYDDAYEGDSCLRSGYVYYYDTSNLKLTVDMAEAGAISFWWKRKGSGWASFKIDDAWYSLEAEDVTVWNKFTMELKAGTHVFQWNYQSPYTGDSNGIFIDKISIPGYEIIDPDSQDPDNTLWTTTDKNLYRSGVIGNGRYSYKTMTVKGKGVLSFKWRTSSEQHFDRLAVTFDGNPIVPAISGETEWTKVVYTNEAAGVHSVRWRYSKDSDTTAGDDCGYVKDVRWGDGTIPFEYDKTEGVYRSGKIDNNDQSEAELLISGSSDFDFRWKVSSQSDHDFLSCYVDGVLKSSISGETDWDWISCGGTGWENSAHTIKFVYSKDASESAGDDCGYLTSYNFQYYLLAWRVRGLTPTVGSGAWAYQSSDGYYLSAANAPSILPVTVSSNGKITFQYRAYESGMWSSLGLYVDGKCVKSFYMDSMSGEYWNSASYTIREPGTHLIEWRASGGRVCVKLSNDYYSKWYTGTRRPWVIDMQDYVNEPKDDIGDKGWVESTVGYSSGYRSGKIASNQTSRVTARVGSSGENLSFRWKTTGEHVGKLNFYVNGELKASLTGATEEQYFSEYLSLYGREQNEFVWEYVNGEGAKSGEDFGWIYDVQWGYMGGSLEWGTLGSEEEEDPGWKEPVYHWTTVTNADNTVTLTGVSPNPTGCVRFPAKVDGRQVVSIANNFFDFLYWGDKERIAEVIIPQGVTNIGYNAFSRLNNLADVTFPAGLRTIGSAAFSGTSLKHVKIPEGTETISGSAFSGAGCQMVVLPSTLVDLATMPEYPSQRANNPFVGCDNECRFSFPRGNEHYSVIEGHIVSADGVLVSGTMQNGRVIIPSAVSSIACEAFANMNSLTDVRIPGNVKQVCLNAFYKSSMTSLTVAEGVERIEGQAFWYCRNLKSVTLSEGLKYLGGVVFSDTPVASLVLPVSLESAYNPFYGMTNLTSVTFRGNAPDLSSSSSVWYSVPASCIVKVKKGTTGWDRDPLSAELPSSGYWPGTGSYGRPIQWYGDTPSWWTKGWWNDGSMNYTKSNDGWTIANGIYKSAEWKDTAYVSSVHTNYFDFTVSGEGIFECDMKMTGYSSSYPKFLVVVDGIGLKSYSVSSSGTQYWRHFAYAVSGSGNHKVTLLYITPNNYYGNATVSYLQNVKWSTKSGWVRPDYVWQARDNDDGTVTITNVSPKICYDVKVPSVIGGRQVTGLDTYDRKSYKGNVFYENTLVTSAELPESITTIGDYSFYNCSCLKSVRMPSRVNVFGSYLFYHCDMLESVNIPDGVQKLDHTFSCCGSIKSLEIPSSVVEISDYTFNDCRQLRELIFYGDSPKFYNGSPRAGYTFQNVPGDCVIKVMKGTSGWNVEIPGAWYDFPIEYIETPPHTVTFDANGGKCAVPSMTVYEHSIYSGLPIATHPEPWFAFDGWYTDPTGGNPVTEKTTVTATSDHTLYAHWKTALYPVRVTTLHGHAEGGEFEYGTVVTLKAPETVTKDGTQYVCLGTTSFPKSGTSVTLTVGTNLVSFCWDVWKTNYNVTVESGANGRIQGAVSGWYEHGTRLSMQAVGDAGYCLSQWGGDLSTAVADRDHLEDVVLLPHAISATFKQGSLTPYADGSYTETVEGNEWQFVVSGGKVTITGGPTVSGNYVIPGMLGNCQVVAIGDRAFAGSDGIYVFPNSVTNIGEKAFYNPEMTSVALPRNIKHIGYQAFYGSNKSSPYYGRYGTIASLSLYDASDVVIEEEAFYGQLLRSIDINGRNISIGTKAFYQTYETYSGPSSYGGCSIRLTGSGISVGVQAFAHYQYHTVNVDISGVRKLSDRSFEEVGLYFRESDDPWHELGTSSVRISSELKEADPDAFYRSDIGRIDVDSLDDVFGVDGWLSFVHSEFWCYYHAIVCKGAFTKELRIPDGVSSIPSHAFGDIYLERLVVPASVRRLEHHALAGMRLLPNIEFLGDAPLVSTNCFDEIPTNICVVTVPGDAAGWDDDDDGRWQGFLLKYVPTNPRVVTFDPNGGMVEELERVVQVGKVLGYLPTPKRNGYTFTGWFTESGEAVSVRTAIGQDTVLYAHWAAVPLYSVRFDANGGTVYADALVVEHNQYPGYDRWPTPYRKNYQFDGWYTAARGGSSVGAYTRVTADVTYYAHWSRTMKSVLTDNDSAISLSTGGYVNWYLDDNGRVRSGSMWDGHSQTSWLELSFSLPSTTTVTANWSVSSEASYDKLYYKMDGTQQDVISGSASRTTSKSLSSGSHTARWEYTKDGSVSRNDDCGYLNSFSLGSARCNVTFNANGGLVTETLRKVSNGGYVQSLPKPVWRGYDFSGWYTAATGGSKISDATVITSDVMYYAHWTPTRYRIKYLNVNGAANPNPDTCTMFERTELAPLANVEGAIFVGWEPAVIPEGTMGDIEVMARWLPYSMSDVIKGGIVENDAHAPWLMARDAKGWMLQSGAIGDDDETTLSMLVYGKGTLTFEWSASSEVYKKQPIDYCLLKLDGKYSIDMIGGEVAWAPMTVEVDTDGSHVFTWTYFKDESGFSGNDCAWLRNVIWTPASKPIIEGGECEYTPPGWSSPIIVSDDWLIKYGLVEVGDTEDGAAAALIKIGKNGIPCYESYLFGLDPTEEVPASEQVMVLIDGFDNDGVPIIKSNLAPRDASRVKIIKLGRQVLTEGNWVEETDTNRLLFRYYKIKAEIIPKK